MIDHLTVALDEGYIADDVFSVFKNKVLEIIKILNGYIAYLLKAKAINK